jgi:hypothetical protein
MSTNAKVRVCTIGQRYSGTKQILSKDEIRNQIMQIHFQSMTAEQEENISASHSSINTTKESFLPDPESQ